jgi:DUF438 domain-containing protein
MMQSDLDLLKEERLSLIREKCEICSRATGETTRLIDYYIQELYKNYKEWVLIEDHYHSRNAQLNLINSIKKRMGIEHPSDILEYATDEGKHLLKLKHCSSKEYKKQELKRINERLETVKKLIFDLS